MANINGDVQKRVTLIANTETIVEFNGYFRNIALQVNGGEVVFKLNGTISGIDDNTANTLGDGESFDCVESTQILSLHLFSASVVEVQWDTY
jgi:hypothetical protein